MNGEQITQIKRSFYKINSEALAESFYDHLFSIQPNLRLLFPDDFGEQKEKLLLMLGAAIDMLDEPDKLVPLLEESGRRHALFGTREENYNTARTALLSSLRETLAADFTAETEVAWTRLYEMMSETMKRGARSLTAAPEQNQTQIVRRTEMKNYIAYFCAGALAMLLTASAITAAPVVRGAFGANAAAIQGTINVFRGIDLGGVNNGVGGSYKYGRREISWDDVPDNFAFPEGFLAGDYYNTNSPRGAVFSSPCNYFGQFAVSARQGHPSGAALRFGNVNPTYTSTFTTFSGDRLFSSAPNSLACNIVTVTFFVPGTNIPATVSGFGAVFTDVDNIDGSQFGSRIIPYDAAGNRLPGTTNLTAPVANGGLSFIGISYNGGERIARVDIISGKTPMNQLHNDGQNDYDVVAMDDFIYGEPRAMQYHDNDFDGDGSADPSVFRPSAGMFYVQNSGSNTVDFIPFGSNGDIPVSGDFDGDQRADVAIFRPSAGEWWFQKSSNGQYFAARFGTSTDKPMPGDFDKDGKTDIAFWRPSNGHYYVLKSSSSFSQFYAFPWGVNGDIPVGAAVVP